MNPTSLSCLSITVEILQVVVEVGVSSTEVPAQLGGVGRENSCDVRLPKPDEQIINSQD